MPSPEAKLVFPCLKVTASGGSKKFRFALLVSDENRLAQKLLLSLGFKKQNVSSGPMSDWTALICKAADGPFGTLTDDAAAPDVKKLSTYLDLEYTGSDEIIKPTKVAVVKKELDSSLLNENAECDFCRSFYRRVRLSLRGEPQREKNKAQVKFEIPIHAAGGKIATLKFEDRGVEADEWKGGILKFANSHVQGDSIEFSPHRLALIDEELVLSTNKEFKEISVTKWADFDISGPELSRQFATGVGAPQPRIQFAGDPEGSELTLTARFPLIMAVADRVPTALSILVPLVDAAKDKFNFTFVIEIGSGFDHEEHPLLEWNALTNRWKFSEAFWQATEANAWSMTVQWGDGNADFGLGGFDWNLADLIGDNFGIGFHLRPFVQMLEQEVQEAIPCQVRNGALCVPVELGVKLGSFDLNLCLDLMFDTESFRLQTNRLAFRLPSAAYCSGKTIINLGVMALMLPSRPPGNYLDAGSVDGYFDFEKREFVLFASQGVTNPVVVIPGFQKDIFGGLDQRLVFEMVPFDPDSWPRISPSKRPVFLRINEEGLSLNAKVMLAHNPTVVPEKKAVEGQGADEEVVAQLKPIRILPANKKGERTSEIVIINNTIRKAILLGEIDIPGAKDLSAAVEVGMRQEKRGKAPILHAEIDLETKNNKPIGGSGNWRLHDHCDRRHASPPRMEHGE